MSSLLAYERISFSHDEAHFAFRVAEFTITMAVPSGFLILRSIQERAIII